MLGCLGLHSPPGQYRECPGMQPGPDRAAQILIESLAEQGVDEANLCSRALKNQPAAAEGFQRGINVGPIQPGDLGG
jgi:hypothetical protein